jgi:hypothetical protein
LDSGRKILGKRSMEMLRLLRNCINEQRQDFQNGFCLVMASFRWQCVPSNEFVVVGIRMSTRFQMDTASQRRPPKGVGQPTQSASSRAGSS